MTTNIIRNISSVRLNIIVSSKEEEEESSMNHQHISIRTHRRKKNQKARTWVERVKSIYRKKQLNCMKVVAMCRTLKAKDQMLHRRHWSLFGGFRSRSLIVVDAFCVHLTHSQIVSSFNLSNLDFSLSPPSLFLSHSPLFSSLAHLGFFYYWQFGYS